jgi:alpha-L-fucosidase
MRRRDLLVGGAAAAGLRPVAGQPSPAHRLPSTDHHYRLVRSYVEETPVPEYHWASEKAREAFRDIKYGIRIHWGIYSDFGLGDASWPFLQLSNEDRQRYQEAYKTFNPSAFDADAWMDLFSECGLRMFAFTTKHHDGFSMFDTRTHVNSRVNWIAPGGPRLENCELAYSIAEAPFKRDIVGELCTAARRKGIKIDLYFSHPDWYDAAFRPYAYHPLLTPSSGEYMGDEEYARESKQLGDRAVVVPDPTPAEVDRMMVRHRAQLTELLTNYGPIDMMCLDQWLGKPVWPKLRATILALRKLQPDVMFRARGIGNYGDYYTPEGFVPGAPENTSMPWFAIYGLAGWVWTADTKRYKGSEWIVRNLIDTVAKGGNFMVGAGPDGKGRFHPVAIAQLREAGAWLRVNGEAIYATRPREGELWREGDAVRFTRTKDARTVYALVMTWPGKELRLSTVRPRQGSEIRLLGYDRPLAWKLDAASGLAVQIPEPLQDETRRPSRYSWALRIPVA